MPSKLLNAASSGSDLIFKVNVSGSSTEAFRLSNSGSVVFNESGGNVDFRVEGDTDANLLFCDASADSIGIGTSAPGTKFQIKDNGTPNSVVASIRQDDENVYALSIKNDTFGTNIIDGMMMDFTNSGVGRVYTRNNTGTTSLHLGANNTANRVVIASDGKVGIGSDTPAAKLQVTSNPSTYTDGVLVGPAVSGTSLWHDNSGSTVTYLDNRYDSALATLKLRMRAAGTPVDALSITGAGNATVAGQLTTTGVYFGSGSVISNFTDYTSYNPNWYTTLGSITVNSTSCYYARINSILFLHLKLNFTQNTSNGFLRGYLPASLTSLRGAFDFGMTTTSPYLVMFTSNSPNSDRFQMDFNNGTWVAGNTYDVSVVTQIIIG